ncbi:plasmid mobilization relaxosome protein MobC, partial [Escherichia coli]|uniref:plasmid mobilization relaxosome protein MobC n=1 Tax=Escherichia coli TaxID=562 RepID=UPI0020248D69
AVWMRRVCLGEPVARSGRLPTLAPPLLRQLAANGNNLNHTAPKVNMRTGPSGSRGPGVGADAGTWGVVRSVRQGRRESVGRGWRFACRAGKERGWGGGGG